MHMCLQFFFLFPIRIYNYFHKNRVAILRGHSTSVRDIAYSKDGRHLASASMDGDVKIWAADKGSQVRKIHTQFLLFQLYK